MVEETPQSSNVHELPNGLHRTPSDSIANSEGDALEDDYDRDTRELLVDMDELDQDEKDNENNAKEKRMTYIAAVILACLMIGSYIGYDWYEQRKIAESAAAIAALESQVNPAVMNKSTTLQVDSVVPQQNELLNLIDSTNVTENRNIQTQKNIGNEDQSMSSEEILPISTQDVETVALSPVNESIPATTASQLQIDMKVLLETTERIKSAVSDLNFKIDQNSERLTMAVVRIDAIEKKLTYKPDSKTINRTDQNRDIRPDRKTKPNWIDQLKVVSIRNIGTQFIAKLTLPGGVKRMSVGDRYRGWMVEQIDLDSGMVALRNKAGQQRIVSL